MTRPDYVAPGTEVSYYGRPGIVSEYADDDSSAVKSMFTRVRFHALAGSHPSLQAFKEGRGPLIRTRSLVIKDVADAAS